MLLHASRLNINLIPAILPDYFRQLCYANRHESGRNPGNTDDWQLVASRGSHRQFKHPEKPGRVTVAGKPSDDLAPGTLNSIFKQAGLKE
ncbi:MAG: type II toxin-antitoxin system HicA family toxin [Gallionella sp.]